MNKKKNGREFKNTTVYGVGTDDTIPIIEKRLEFTLVISQRLFGIAEFIQFGGICFGGAIQILTSVIRK